MSIYIFTILTQIVTLVTHTKHKIASSGTIVKERDNNVRDNRGEKCNNHRWD